MAGLILKDLLHLKRQARMLVLLVAFYILLALTSGDSSMFAGIVSLLMVMLTVTAMAYDEQAKWEPVALSAPLVRSDLVWSKYLLGGLLSGLALVVNFLFLAMTGDGGPGTAALVALGLLGVSLFFLFLILPVLFWLGVEKGRIAMMAILLVPTALVLLAARFGLPMPGDGFLRALPWVAPIVLVLLAVLSIRCSLWAAEKKEY